MNLIHPSTVKDKLAIAGGVIALLGGLWSVLIYAVDYEQSLVKKPELTAIINATQMSLDAMKRDTLESKIFELNLIERPTRPQDALKTYYLQKLQELDKKKDK